MTDSTVPWTKPDGGPNATVWADLLEPLKDEPGEWGFVRTMKYRSAATTKWRLEKREQISMPEGEFEFRLSKRGDLGDIYARYVGDG